MTPEIKARVFIDQKLEQAGWVIQDMKQLNLGAALGVAVREYPTDSGEADYLLFVNRTAVGVIEAKRDSAGENLTVTESQTVRYANATSKWRKDSTPLRFLFEATGQIIRFTDGADPAPRSREIFHFFKPETLVSSVGQAPLASGAINSLRRRLAEQMPELPERNLRDCQVSALDPDAIVQTALATAQAKGITRSEDTLAPEEIEAARAKRLAVACEPFDKPEVRDEIAALDFFYQQPYQRRALTFEMLEELHEHLSKPPLMLTTERLWSAYARVQTSAVKGADKKRQLTDLVSLVRFALGMEGELKPFAEEVDKRFQTWIFRHNAQRGTAFTPEQTEWLRLMKDHIASSCSISRDDFDYAELADKGGLQKAWGLFGKELDILMNEMNGELVA